MDFPVYFFRNFDFFLILQLRVFFFYPRKWKVPEKRVFGIFFGFFLGRKIFSRPLLYFFYSRVVWSFLVHIFVFFLGVTYFFLGQKFKIFLGQTSFFSGRKFFLAHFCIFFSRAVWSFLGHIFVFFLGVTYFFLGQKFINFLAQTADFFFLGQNFFSGR